MLRTPCFSQAWPFPELGQRPHSAETGLHEYSPQKDVPPPCGLAGVVDFLALQTEEGFFGVWDARWLTPEGSVLNESALKRGIRLHTCRGLVWG